MKKTLYGLTLMMLPWMAHSALFDRGNGMIYDDVLDVTWLQNANYASVDLNDGRVAQIINNIGTIDGHQLLPPPDIFDPSTRTTIPSDHRRDAPNSYNGQMTWWGAKAWVMSLNYQGYTGWRLPKLIHKADGTLSSELTELVNAGDMGLFENYLQQPPGATTNEIDSWWLDEADNSSTAILDEKGFPEAAYSIHISRNAATDQAEVIRAPAPLRKKFRIFAWAVHDGDVAMNPPAVPLPGAVWLLGSGLLGLGGVIRRRR